MTAGTPEDSELSVVRSEEQLHVGTRVQDAGRLLVRKLVGERRDTEDVERRAEQMNVETSPAEEGDTGEVITLPDGSLSIPLFEERIVVEKRLFVRERVIVRKYSVAHREQVEADVRVERVEIVADEQVSDRVDAADDALDLLRAPDTAPPAEAAPAPQRTTPRTTALSRPARPRPAGKTSAPDPRARRTP